MSKVVKKAFKQCMFLSNQIVLMSKATSADVNEHWSNWKDLFLTAVKERIPIKTVGDKNSPPWIDGEARHLIRKKYAALKKFR